MFDKMSMYGFIFCLLLQFLNVNSQDSVDGKTVERSEESSRSYAPKYNAVLFLADPTERASSQIKRSAEEAAFDEGFFKLEEKCRVKHCTPSLESKIGDSVDSVVRFNRGTCKCDELLKTSLLALINYCRDTLGMTTAMVSITNNSFSSDIRFRNAETQVVTHNPEKSCNSDNADSSDESQDDSSDEPPLLTSAKNVSVRADTMPKIQKVSGEGDVFPIFELLNPERRIRFNDLGSKKKVEKRSKLDVVTSPEHTEIFKIRSKRDAQKNRGAARDVPTYNKEEKPKNIWDILNVMENIRLSFFNNILDDEAERLQEESIDMGALGSVSEISLFEIVKKTLTAITCKNDTAFLMIVIGGRLADKCDPYSPLMQSIKYVIENTDEQNTLIVLTGYCPKTQQQSWRRPTIGDEMEDSEHPKKHKMVPVYARGCKSRLFEDSRELYDVPVAIQKFLAEKNGKGEDSEFGGMDSEGDLRADPPSGKRNKRALSDDQKRDAQNQKESTANLRQVIATYAAIAALFIFCF